MPHANGNRNENGNGRSSSTRRIDGKVVVVTGASGGVGRALVRRLAARGCRVGLLARGRDALEAAERDVEELGGRGPGACRPTSAVNDQVEAAAEAVEREFGPIDVWINDAMVSMYAPFWEISPEEYKHITDVTYHGQVYGTMAALKRMRPRDRGAIVQVGSALAAPLDPAPVGLLRREARHRRVHRVDPLGTDPRQEQREDHHRPPAGREHDAVRVDEEPHAAQAAADGDDLPAGGGGGRHPLRGRAPAPEEGDRRLPGAGRRSSARSSSRARWTTTWPTPRGKGRNCPSRPTRTTATTSGSRCPATTARTGRSTPRPSVRSAQLWATKHRTGLLAALAGIGLGAAVAYGAGRKRQD